MQPNIGVLPIAGDCVMKCMYFVLKPNFETEGMVLSGSSDRCNHCVIAVTQWYVTDGFFLECVCKGHALCEPSRVSAIDSDDEHRYNLHGSSRSTFMVVNYF